MEIWHNPQCSKSRAAAKALDEAGVDYTVRRYLEDPPSREEIVAVLDRLGLEPWQITRTGEPEAAVVKGLGKSGETREAWIDALAAHPRLIQRPILIAEDGTTVVGRDPESLALVLRL